MRWCLYSTGMAGHRPGLISGLTDAAAAAGYAPMVAAPKQPPDAGDRVEWLPVETFGSRSVTRGRGQLRAVLDLAVEGSADVFVDMNLEKHIWHLPAQMPASMRRFHVVHHADRFDRDRMALLERAAARLVRRRLGLVRDRGGRIVVHTGRAAEIVGSDQTLQTGYPVVSEKQLPILTPEALPGEHLLFVGGIRPDKGFDLLLNAAHRADPSLEIHVVGPQDPAVRARYEQLASVQVVWHDYFHDRAQLSARYRSCLLVVMPYRNAFHAHGGASSAMLEVLAHGVPLVTTPALAPQLPESYGGAVVSESDEPDALAPALSSAVNASAQLRSRALLEGPAFVESNHTYERYLRSLAAAIG